MIISTHNSKIQWVRKLQSDPHLRRENRLFVIEGVRLVEEAQQAGWQAELLLFTNTLNERGSALVKVFQKQGTAIEEISSAVMQAASDTQTPQGILAVLHVQTLPQPANPTFLLILDTSRDPGNLGTILRSAAAAGVQTVLLTPGTADPYSPKVVRAGMGAHFHLPVYAPSWEKLHEYINSLRKQAGLTIYLANAQKGLSYTQANFRGSLGLVIGSEAQGASEEIQTLVDSPVHIPMPGMTESLNAAAAASILLFEVVRQRQQPQINIDKPV